MPSVPLSKFIEFTVAQGTSRVRIVSDSKRDYEPQRDFYKRLREITQRQFIDGWNAAAYKQEIKKAATSKKANSYETCRVGLTGWVKGKKIGGRKGRPGLWTAGGLDVKVNPELRLTVGDQKYSTKLYFARDELSVPRIESLLYLLAEEAPAGHEAAILDTRRGRLITADGLDPDLGVLLASDAAAFTSLYG